MSRHPPHRQAMLTLMALACLSGPALAVGDAPGTCTAKSSAQVAPLVELYTSEGCSSCPPADRWMSALKADPGVVALAFHVDYWDRLGWKDRFASAAFTQRQALQRQSNGARFSYTPQVVVDGRDHPSWHAGALPSSQAARPVARLSVTLQGQGGHYTANVLPAAGAPARLAAYWAVTENDHRTTVKAGENDGATLTHDHVVRAYQAVSAWPAEAGRAVKLEFDSEPPASPRPRHVNLVVLDADTGRPVQALRLGC